MKNQLTKTVESLTAKKAFTLIELLVVVAIIALLVSILMPSLSVAKELARSAVCSSNQRSIGLNFQLYAEDYDGCFPLAKKQNPSDGLPYWLVELYDAGLIDDVHKMSYTPGHYAYGSDAELYCPSNTAKYNGQFFGFSYAMPLTGSNPKGVGGNNYNSTPDYTKMSEVSKPSNTVSILESKHPWYAVLSYYEWLVGGYGYPDIHNGRANYLFADCHVESKDDLWFDWEMVDIDQ